MAAARFIQETVTSQRHDPRGSLGALAALAVVLLVAALLATSPSSGAAGTHEVVQPQLAEVIR